MPSARSTLALVAAFAYGASVMAMPMQNSYDLVERDYDDLAELDARMYDTDIEEYYVRDVTTPAVAAPTPDAAAAAPPAATSGVSTHHHKHKHPHHKHPHHKHHSQKHGKKGEVSPTTTTDSLAAPAPSSDAANSKLVAREPRGGKGRGGKKGRGRKGRKHGKGRRGGKGGKRAKAAAEASAEPAAGGDAPAAEPIAARGLFSKKKTADEKASVTSETTPKAEEKEVDAAKESSPATSTRKHKHKHSKKAGKRHGLHRLHRHRLGKASKKSTPTSSLDTAATPAATV